MDRFVCPPDHKHGENGTCYQGHKCRCADCRQGRAEYEYWRNRNRDKTAIVDATGTRRRLQALAALGWSAREIAERHGLHRDTVRWWYRMPRVERATAVKVAAWYDEMSMMLPPMETSSERRSATTTRGQARAKGWPPPLAWDDDMIDDPNAAPDLEGIAQITISEVFAERCDSAVIDAAIEGRAPDLSPPERRQVITVLNERRWSARRIAEHIGCSTRTVDRIRDELDLPIYLAGRNNLNRERNAA